MSPKVVVTVLALALFVGLLPGPTAAQAPAIRVVEQIVYGPSLVDFFSRPSAVATIPDRDLFVVCDTANGRIVVFDTNGRSRGSVFCNTDGVGQSLGEPGGIGIDPRGRMFVVDIVNGQVEVLTPYGGHIAYLDPQLPADLADEVRPQDIAVGASGRIYILLGGERAGIVILGTDGSRIGMFGFEEWGWPTFVKPRAIAVSPDEEKIAVTDPGSEFQVSIFNPEGKRLAAFGPHVRGDEGFSLAAGVAWGPDDTLWVPDTVRHSISVFDHEGRYLGRIGGFGNAPGQFNFPAGCAFLGHDRLVVVERAGARCQVLALEGDMFEPPAQEPPVAAIASTSPHVRTATK